MEALKKGADEVIFVEQDPVLCVFIKNSAQKKKLSDKAKIHNTECSEIPSKLFSTIWYNFCRSALWIRRNWTNFKVLEKKDLLTEDGVLILQHHKNESLRENLKGVKIYKCYRYGDTLLTVYRRQEWKNRSLSRNIWSNNKWTSRCYKKKLLKFWWIDSSGGCVKL